MTIQERIKCIKIEDFIYIIYYVIITLSLIANKIERRYLYLKNKEDKEKYRNLLLLIFGIALIVYIYNFIISLNDCYNCNEKDRYLNELSTLASLLILISGIIYLYIINKDQDINVEIAFS